MKNRFFALILVSLMLLSVFSLNASAVDIPEDYTHYGVMNFDGLAGQTVATGGDYAIEIEKTLFHKLTVAGKASLEIMSENGETFGRLTCTEAGSHVSWFIECPLFPIGKFYLTLTYRVSSNFTPKNDSKALFLRFPNASAGCDAIILTPEQLQNGNYTEWRTETFEVQPDNDFRAARFYCYMDTNNYFDIKEAVFSFVTNADTPQITPIEAKAFAQAATDPAVTDAPVTDAPVTDAPVTAAPVTDAPVTDAPATTAAPTTPPTGSYDFAFMMIAAAALVAVVAVVVIRKKARD